jgi:hypothetical protein
MQISLPNELIQKIQRISDGDATYRHVSSGIRAAQVDHDRWVIEPILVEGIPSIKGYFSRAELQEFIRKAGLRTIAIQSIHWRGGAYHATWNPVIPGQQNHLRGPSDLWGAIASNLGSPTKTTALMDIDKPMMPDVSNIMDNRTPTEASAKYISLSLRSMDTCVEQIADFYNEQLVNLTMKITGPILPTNYIMSQNLFAHVHSYFLHLGTARDNLATFIAIKLSLDPNQVDDMTRLIEKLRDNHFANDPILTGMRNSGFLVRRPNTTDKWDVGGWLKEVNTLRNRFVHRQPYGSRLLESTGTIKAIDKDAGLYRYFQPIHKDDNFDTDLLDEILRHYRECTKWFHDAAKASGENTAMQTITSRDIISISITHR